MEGSHGEFHRPLEPSVAGVGPAGRDEPDTQGGASVSDAGTVDRSPVAELRVWIAAIDALAAAVNSQAPLEALLDQIARTACQLLGYEYGGVLLADPDRRALRIRGFWGLTEDYVQRVNEDAPLLLAGTGALTDSPSRRAFSDRAPVLVSDITQDSTFGPWGPAALVQGYRAIASVPLRSQAEVIGTLNVYSSAPKALDAAGVDLLQVLANHAGIALETTALLERDRDRLAELTRLNDSLTHQASLLRQAAAIHDRLTGDALRGGGVSSTATALADRGRLRTRPCFGGACRGLGTRTVPAGAGGARLGRAGEFLRRSLPGTGPRAGRAAGALR
jgi:GAF domain-containing protein